MTQEQNPNQSGFAQLGVAATPNAAPSADPANSNTPPANQSGFAKLGVAATPDAATDAGTSTQDQPGLGSRIWEGAKQFATPFVNAAKPAETPTEHLIELTAGSGALAAYRAAHGLVTSAQNMVKAGPSEYVQALSDFKRAHDEFANKDYRNAASSAVSAASDVGGIVDPVLHQGSGDVRELSEGARPGGNLATPLTRVGLGAATALIGGEAVGAEDEAATAATRLKVNPFRQIMEGKAVAQEPAITAIRGGVQDSVDLAGTSPRATRFSQSGSPILEGNQTVVSEPLNALKTKEAAAYKQIDDLVQFDLKAAKVELKDNQYAIKQPGVTPAAKKAMQDAIDEGTTKIQDAEAKLTKAGIDPKSGDAVHMARMAGEDFQKKIVQATSTDGTVNVDRLLNSSKALRFSPRGDRLAQFMGQESADTFINQLEAAQKAGVRAVKTQKIAKWVGGTAGLGLVGEGAHLLLSTPTGE